MQGADDAKIVADVAELVLSGKSGGSGRKLAFAGNIRHKMFIACVLRAAGSILYNDVGYGAGLAVCGRHAGNERSIDTIRDMNWIGKDLVGCVENGSPGAWYS